jgi:hypothetical protein
VVREVLQNMLLPVNQAVPIAAPGQDHRPQR